MGSNGLTLSPLQLTMEKLNGKNFCEWAQPIQLVLKGNGKLGYLTITTPKLVSIDIVSLQKWTSKNSMVIAWLVNSKQPYIGKTYLFLPTAKDVWDVVQEMYFDVGDSSSIFDIKTQPWQMKQERRMSPSISWR